MLFTLSISNSLVRMSNTVCLIYSCCYMALLNVLRHPWLVYYSLQLNNLQTTLLDCHFNVVSAKYITLIQTKHCVYCNNVSAHPNNP